MRSVSDSMATVINPTVLITGASTGIGLALVRQLAGREYRVVATARPQSLARFSAAGIQDGSNIIIRPLDITDAAARAALVSEIEAEWGCVDILVNNAAVTYRSVVEEMTSEEDRLQIETNYIAPLALIRRVLP